MPSWFVLIEVALDLLRDVYIRDIRWEAARGATKSAPTVTPTAAQPRGNLADAVEPTDDAVVLGVVVVDRSVECFDAPKDS